MEDYLLGGKSMKWGTIGLSVMATQASAITFLSTPGQAFESGLGFVQNYFGLPLALIIVCAVFIPIYYKLKVYTAYEFLESRFDLKTRILGAFLFLLQRGLAAGITIYAPAIILSTMLGWDLSLTILLVGVLVIVYTVSGGATAVSLTQKYQMTIILFGMVLAFTIIINYLSEYMSFTDALVVGGKLGKLQAVDFDFNFEKRYTFWSGLLGGCFLALSYFGTDQSQVARYLTGASIGESRMGMMFNAVLKIPMQFFILLTGVLVFVFFQFVQPPLNFNPQAEQVIVEKGYAKELSEITEQFEAVHKDKKNQIEKFVTAYHQEDAQAAEVEAKKMMALNNETQDLRNEAKSLLVQADEGSSTKDSDYVFLTFIINYLPTGVIGLLLAVILSAAMSSTASELNALGSTTMVDFYKRLFENKEKTNPTNDLKMSRIFTLIWGVVAIVFAFMAHLAENLIELVNIIGSLFYGTILGIFLVAFFLKQVKGKAVFIAAIITQIVIFSIEVLVRAGAFKLSYLMYNVIGCLLVMLLAFFIQLLDKKTVES